MQLLELLLEKTDTFWPSLWFNAERTWREVLQSCRAETRTLGCVSVFIRICVCLWLCVHGEECVYMCVRTSDAPLILCKFPQSLSPLSCQESLFPAEPWPLVPTTHYWALLPPSLSLGLPHLLQSEHQSSTDHTLTSALSLCLSPSLTLSLSSYSQSFWRTHRLKLFCSFFFQPPIEHFLWREFKDTWEKKNTVVKTWDVRSGP